MNRYVILQCTNRLCNFRFPAEAGNYSIYCPLCGNELNIREYEVNNGYAQFNKKNTALECVLDNVRSSYNVGSIFRSASAFSVARLFLCGFTPTPDQAKVKKTSLGAEKFVLWSHEPNALHLIQQKKEQGYQIIAVEASLSAQSLLDWSIKSGEQKVLLIFGNEIFGIDPEIRAFSDALLQIPITGDKKSLNVAAAFSISVFYFSSCLS